MALSLYRLQEITWQGHVAGVEAALNAFKAEQAYPISKIREVFVCL